MRNEQSLYSVKWGETITEGKARDILGSDHFDWAVAKGAAFCRSRAAGWWQANNPECYAAYNCAEKVAK